MTDDSIQFRLAGPDDNQLEWFDNTKLTAVNTCPTWGVITYGLNKTLSAGGRALALECGGAMHEVFAWVRLCHLRYQYADRPQLGSLLYLRHGTRIFGGERFGRISEIAEQGADHLDKAKRGAIACLDTSGYYDDPRDKRRTLNNMEESALHYIDRWRWRQSHVWVRNEDDPESDVGIEIPFDLVVQHPTVPWFRFVGKIDGLHRTKEVVTLEENKTASRLNEAWQLSFNLASQVTGYCVAASVFTNTTVREARVHGLTIPLPKSYDFGGIDTVYVRREPYHIHKWVDWIVHSVSQYRLYQSDPLAAPQYTHSCNRYFRPCSLLPFCDADYAEQRRTINEMETKVWNPLHELED